MILKTHKTMAAVCVAGFMPMTQCRRRLMTRFCKPFARSGSEHNFGTGTFLLVSCELQNYLSNKNK